MVLRRVICALRSAKELETVGNWPAEARWPTLLVTLPVEDAARARKIAEALISIELTGEPWTRSEKDGVTVYHAPSFGGLVSFSPAFAVSDKMMFVGSDAAVVEAEIGRVVQPGEMEKSAIFREATTWVPAADSAFNYVDTRRPFERADAAVRPLLLMGAAFSPALGKNIILWIPAAGGDRQASFADRHVAALPE